MDDESLIEFRKLAREFLRGRGPGTAAGAASKPAADPAATADGASGGDAGAGDAGAGEAGAAADSFEALINQRISGIWWNRFTDAFIVSLPLLVFCTLIVFPRIQAKRAIYIFLAIVLFAGVGLSILLLVTYIISLVTAKSRKSSLVPPARNLAVFAVMILFTILISAFMSNIYGGFVNGAGAYVRIAVAAVVTSFVLAYIFVPSYLKRSNTITDLVTFAYGEDRDGYDGFLHRGRAETVSAATLRLGYLRTFDIETTINLDDAMANMRAAIGYSVVRPEDTVDHHAFIEDVIVPRILAMRRRAGYDVPQYASDAVQRECAEGIELNLKLLREDLAKAGDGKLGDSAAARALARYWEGACKPGVFEMCTGADAGLSDREKEALKCADKADSAMTYDDFMWKPQGVQPFKDAYAEKCFGRCKDDCVGAGAAGACEAAVYENGLCYVKTAADEWEVDTKAAGARVYVRSAIPGEAGEAGEGDGGPDKCTGKTAAAVQVLPIYRTGDAVEEILNDIQVVSPMFDMSLYPEFGEEIRDRLRALDPDYDLNKSKYDSVIAALVSESALRSDERTPIEDGGNLKADLEVAREYFDTTTLHKFNKEIAWPIMKGAVNVSARNKLFDRIVGRRKTAFLFYHVMFQIVLEVITAAVLIRIYRSRIFSMENLAETPYPKIPFVILVIVFLVSLNVLIVKRLLRFNNNIRVQAENATRFGDALRELSNFFSAAQYSQAKGTVTGDIVDIPEELQIAVFENDMGKARLKKGSESTETVAGAYPTKERARLMRKMAAVLDEYDKCHNVVNRSGVPFPTALVTAYAGLMVIGVAVLFSVPGVNPSHVVGNIDLAKALAAKADVARLGGRAAEVRAYMQQLCDLWGEVNAGAGRLRDVMQNTSVFLSLVFGIMYVVQTSTDAGNFAKAVGSGILGVVGDCV